MKTTLLSHPSTHLFSVIERIRYYRRRIREDGTLTLWEIFLGRCCQALGREVDHYFLKSLRGNIWGVFSTIEEAEAFASPAHTWGRVWASRKNGQTFCVERRLNHQPVTL